MTGSAGNNPVPVGTMNLFILKYAILIGALLSSTALMAGPLNPQKLFSEPATADSAGITADAVYQFGSDTLYKELDKPGNEYMKAGMEGYSRELVPTEQQQKTYGNRWADAMVFYGTGYRQVSSALPEVASIPDIRNRSEQNAVCDQFRMANEEFGSAEAAFTAAKASSSAGSSSGFTIGMVLPRVSQISSDTEDIELSCMKAVLAARNGDQEGFRESLGDIRNTMTEIKRLHEELKVMSSDFSENE